MVLKSNKTSFIQCQEGYEYGPPPEDTQLRPGSEAVVAEARTGQGGGDGHEHSHSNSDDPLAWLKEAIPGMKSFTIHNIVYCP